MIDSFALHSADNVRRRFQDVRFRRLSGMHLSLSDACRSSFRGSKSAFQRILQVSHVHHSYEITNILKHVLVMTVKTINLFKIICRPNTKSMLNWVAYYICKSKFLHIHATNGKAISWFLTMTSISKTHFSIVICIRFTAVYSVLCECCEAWYIFNRVKTYLFYDWLTVFFAWDVLATNMNHETRFNSHAWLDWECEIYGDYNTADIVS